MNQNLTRLPDAELEVMQALGQWRTTRPTRRILPLG